MNSSKLYSARCDGDHFLHRPPMRSLVQWRLHQYRPIGHSVPSERCAAAESSSRRRPPALLRGRSVFASISIALPSTKMGRHAQSVCLRMLARLKVAKLVVISRYMTAISFTVQPRHSTCAGGPTSAQDMRHAERYGTARTATYTHGAG